MSFGIRMRGARGEQEVRKNQKKKIGGGGGWVAGSVHAT